MPRRKHETDLIRALSEARSVQDDAGRELHGRVIPPLQAAAMLLQLLRLDHPDTESATQKILTALDEAMEQVRRLSGLLAPSPVNRAGLKNALETVVGQHRASFPGSIESSWVRLPRGDAGRPILVLEIVEDLLRRSVGRRGAKTIRLRVHGLAIQLEVDGSGPVAPPSAICRALAEHAGFTFQQTSRRGTIVFTVRQIGLKRSTKNGIQRPSRR